MQDVHSATSPRFMLFLGHDSTILPLLSALKMPADGAISLKWPPYCSYVLIEVYEHVPTRDLYVRFAHQGVVLPAGVGCVYVCMCSLSLSLFPYI